MSRFFFASIMHALRKFLLFHVLTSLGHIATGAKIINGELVPENSMQYMVSVQTEDDRHVCGGFLISEDFVVTAAHCDNLELSHVVVGTHDLRKVDSNKKIYIKERYKHFNYQHPGTGNDIMLLKLSRKAKLDNNVQTISLPTSAMNIRENTLCRVAGWGITETGKSVDELRMVDVSVSDPEICKKDWLGLPKNVICAGGYNTTKGFCQGDSGGPLVCNSKAVGIVSFNYYKICTYPSKPNVYVDVSKYLEWIKEIIHKH